MKPHILYVTCVPYFIPTGGIAKSKFAWLSKAFSGDVLSSVHRKEFSMAVMGEFCAIGPYVPGWFRHQFAIVRKGYFVLYAVGVSSFRHYCRRRYDVVVSHDPFSAGIIALIIAKLLRIKLIVEVNGNYAKADTWSSIKPSLSERVKLWYCRRVIPVVLNQADSVKLLYPAQLQFIEQRIQLQREPHVIHDFVPIAEFGGACVEPRYLVFLGTPWKLKGVDVLIEAFKQLYADYPQYRLKLVGYQFPEERAYFNGLIGEHPAIEVCGPVWYEQAIKLVNECWALVLPSRSEGMGRVLLEAMAAKKPVVASRVDGIPTYVQHGQTGLLFESGSAFDLADKLRILMSDEVYAKRIGLQGYDYVHRNLSEEVFVERYRALVEELVPIRSGEGSVCLKMN